MKIAVPSNDKKTVFLRTGRAEAYMIYETDDGKIIKSYHRPLPEDLVHKHEHGHHGHHGGHRHSHRGLCSFLKDCDVVLLNHIGPHLKETFDECRIRYKMMRQKIAEEAVKEYLEMQYG